MNVKDFDDHGIVPVIKDKIVIGEVVEKLMYKIVEIIDQSFLNNQSKIGESLIVFHDFKCYKNGYFGYEHLFILIGRNKQNLVKYFDTIESLQEELKKVKLELDKDFAYRQIANYDKKIRQLKEDYKLKSEI